MRIVGTIVWLDFEGGFWGIEGDDGAQYRPVEPLPERARVDGCRVRAEVERADVVSFAMWGQSVHVRSLDVLDDRRG